MDQKYIIIIVVVVLFLYLCSKNDLIEGQSVRNVQSIEELWIDESRKVKSGNRPENAQVVQKVGQLWVDELNQVHACISQENCGTHGDECINNNEVLRCAQAIPGYHTDEGGNVQQTVNCVGEWSECSESETEDGNGLECKKTYTITTNKVGPEAQDCDSTDGEVQDCQSDPDNWEAQGTCKNYCPRSVSSTVHPKGDPRYSGWVDDDNDCECWEGTAQVDESGGRLPGTFSGSKKRCGPNGNDIKTPYL